jgi:hypothetical protein
MTVSAKPSTSPVIWLALLVTLGLVYWQWSATPEADVDLVAARPAKPSAVTESRQGTPNTSVSTVDTHRPPESTVNTLAVSGPDDTPALTEAEYFKRQLPTGKPTHVLFAVHEWLPPPVKPPPPPPPQAPPLPYSYVGSLKEMPGGDLVILMQQKKMVMPRLGSQVDAQWRVDREDMQAVYFTYLPLNKGVVLSKTKTAANAVVRQVEPENNPTEEILNQ